MRFIQFLIERQENNNHSLTYHKLLGALDSAHINVGSDQYDFNLGSVVADSTLKELDVRVKKGGVDSVKLGKHKNGNFIIVISTSKFPSRMDIDKLFSENKIIHSEFIKALDDFYVNYRSDLNPTPKTKFEKMGELDNRENLESQYQELIKAISDKKLEYDDALSELDRTENNTIDEFKKASARSAKSKLKKDYFGNSDKEFTKNVLKYPEAEFVSLLDKETKDKIIKRLENYYDQTF